MSAKTGSELILSAQGALGNRSSGYIGAQSVSAAMMDSLNGALMSIARDFDLPAMEKTATLSITSATNSYAVPTLDGGGNPLSIKNYISMILLETGATEGVFLTRLTQDQRDRAFALANSGNKANPICYTVFGGNIELYPYPSSTYTLYFRVIAYPILFTSSTLGSSQPLGVEWDEVVQSLMIADCFQKLQQLDDAQYWNKQASNALSSVRHANQSREIKLDATLRDLPNGGSNPFSIDNPFSSFTGVR